VERNEVLDKVTGIFKEVLDKPDVVLNDLTTANDIEEWDSLAHIHIIVAIERGFNIRFGSKEIQSWDNVGELIDSICTKIS
jgi:acyl carrier protein